ncbi:DinB family protein [Rothia sp. (in: high G+C Gram-positive bacteria)]|uniref:DinB family protein n=1 Tax=Rothia sp. (in: high G+C Gram-positive bacteria) TaxID=1885016 RepID=UPI000EC845B7|nr:hypothetical protein [Rothia sp. (in: high G+C Gram-positive bacteria)]
MRKLPPEEEVAVSAGSSSHDLGTQALPAHTEEERETLLAFLEEHRRLIRETILVLSDEEARLKLVPSLTTPIGLLNHAAFVESVWFICRFGGKTRAEAEIPETVDESFIVCPSDSLQSLAQKHLKNIDQANEIISRLSLEDRCNHPVMGELTLRWVLNHCIRELAQHAGHADILVEQIIAQRSEPAIGKSA